MNHLVSSCASRIQSVPYQHAPSWGLLPNTCSRTSSATLSRKRLACGYVAYPSYNLPMSLMYQVYLSESVCDYTTCLHPKTDGRLDLLPTKVLPMLWQASGVDTLPDSCYAISEGLTLCCLPLYHATKITYIHMRHIY